MKIYIPKRKDRTMAPCKSVHDEFLESLEVDERQSFLNVFREMLKKELEDAIDLEEFDLADKLFSYIKKLAI